MKHSFKSFVSGMLSTATAVTLSGVGMIAQVSAAGTPTDVSVTLTNPVYEKTSAYTVAWKAKSETGINTIHLTWATTPSGTVTSPTNLNTTASTISAVTSKGVDDLANWSKNAASDDNEIWAVATAPVAGITEGAAFSITVADVTNPTIAGAEKCVPAAHPNYNTNSDTCFVRLATLTGGVAGTVVDETAATFTVIKSISVTATVDPILTFKVTGVNSGTTNDALQGGATSVTTTPTLIPFGNVTVAVAKSAQHQLNILTNSNDGYSVYSRFTSNTTPGADGVAGTVLTGTQGTNKISPFDNQGGTAADWLSDSGANGAQTWTAPGGGTPSDHTAWVGMRTNNGVGSSNGTVTGFDNANSYAPPHTGAGIGKRVMIRASSDNGATPTYVTYKIESNAYQPADAYTGTLVYNVVASY